MKVNLLICDIFEDLMPFEDTGYVKMIQHLFTDVHPVALTFEVFEAFAGDLPKTIDKKAIYVISASRANPCSEIPWLVNLKQFIKELHHNKAKIIGISFGHQLIAHTLGGRVENAIVGLALGIREVQLCHTEAINYFSGRKLNLFHYHQQQVVALPPTSELFAYSKFCPIEGFTIGKHIITIQGHPEYSEKYIRFLLKNQLHEVPEILRIKSVESLKQNNNGAEIASYMLQFLTQND